MQVDGTRLPRGSVGPGQPLAITMRMWGVRRPMASQNGWQPSSCEPQGDAQRRHVLPGGNRKVDRTVSVRRWRQPCGCGVSACLRLPKTKSNSGYVDHKGTRRGSTQSRDRQARSTSIQLFLALREVNRDDAPRFNLGHAPNFRHHAVSYSQSNH